jgi:hypothetical protein
METDINGDGRREKLHSRTIEMTGYRRPDGLFEVEARLVDTKPFQITIACSGEDVPADSPIHDLSLVLVHDAAMVVRDVRTAAAATPYAICPLAGEGLRALVGLSMARGWNAELRRRLEKVDNCTHLVGLLGPMATVAFQSMSAEKPQRALAVDASGRPAKLGSCFAYASNREIVRRIWPDFYSGPAEERE